MVFRGKPSKACERCRARKLRCDLDIKACGQCVRAGATCSGYRDTLQLRIQDDSIAIQTKVLRKSSTPSSVHLSVDVQARDVFFAFYVSRTARCWAFLQQFYYPMDRPHHLTLAIEALSLAYFSHQTDSQVALLTARQRYMGAVQTTNKALQSSVEACKHTTLLTVLLLDLFEKITSGECRGTTSWMIHVKGGLSIVRARGLRRFQSASELHILSRLLSHYLGSYVINASPVPDELIAVGHHVETHFDIAGHTLRLTELMIEYAKLRSDIVHKTISNDECIDASLELDQKLQKLMLDMPIAWQYSTVFIGTKSDRHLDCYYNTYPHRNICQAWNGLRVIRLLLNQSVVERLPTSESRSMGSPSVLRAWVNIHALAGEICASVTQYMVCTDSARTKELRLSSSSPDTFDTFTANGGAAGGVLCHTPHERADCYSLIFPLYAAAKSHLHSRIGLWVSEQLRYMGSHFHIRHAETVRQLLRNGAEPCPWEVFGMLGGYAFNN